MPLDVSRIFLQKPIKHPLIFHGKMQHSPAVSSLFLRRRKTGVNKSLISRSRAPQQGSIQAAVGGSIHGGHNVRPPKPNRRHRTAALIHASFYPSLLPACFRMRNMP